MIAVNYEDVEDIGFPCMGQPKLNGERARWDGAYFTSRQGEIWATIIIPHLYEKLKAWSAKNPGLTLDGEFYCHGMPLQEINRRIAINRQVTHKKVEEIDYHAFDIIHPTWLTEERQQTLMERYKPWVPVCRIGTKKEVDVWLNRLCEAGFEGLMLRQLGCPYRAGQTEMLIKVKPWKHGSARITECIEGLGKLKGMLGAFRVSSVAVQRDRQFNISYKVGGGNITEGEREMVWKKKELFIGRQLSIRFRDTSTGGIPLQPQIVVLPKV